MMVLEQKNNKREKGKYSGSGILCNSTGKFYNIKLYDFLLVLQCSRSINFDMKVSTYAIDTGPDFGKGYANTGKIIEIWDKNGTGEGSYSGERNIKTKYKEGWYIPSSGDWGAFADYLKQKTYNPESGSYIENSGNYNSLYDLSPHYWTSSQISASNVWVVFFSNGVVGASGVLNTDFVRLGATF